MQVIHRFYEHGSDVKHVAFLPDGRHVLSAALGPNPSFISWDATTGKEVRRLAVAIKQVASAVSSSIDGRYLLIGSGRDARLWDVETDREVRQFKGHRGIVSCVAFSRDRKHALTTDMYNDAGRDGCAMHLWDVATGQELRRYTNHPGQVQRAAFAPDGQHILTAYENGSILVWETGSPSAKP
jgi:WD40 repeat protein